VPVARIDRFTSRQHAEMACGLLRAHGIEARVSADDAGGVHPDIPFGIGGTAVVVMDEDYDDAIALLDAEPAAWEEPEAATVPPSAAPDGAAQSNPWARRLGLLLSTAFVLLFVLQRLGVIG
jgi:hypothetical protein